MPDQVDVHAESPLRHLLSAKRKRPFGLFLRFSPSDWPT